MSSSSCCLLVYLVMYCLSFLSSSLPSQEKKLAWLRHRLAYAMLFILHMYFLYVYDYIHDIWVYSLSHSEWNKIQMWILSQKLNWIWIFIWTHLVLECRLQFLDFQISFYIHSHVKGRAAPFYIANGLGGWGIMWTRWTFKMGSILTIRLWPLKFEPLIKNEKIDPKCSSIRWISVHAGLEFKRCIVGKGFWFFSRWQ